MSNMPVLLDNSGPPQERRGQARQPLSALAYLDIGADNGGIVLNVSEDGLALQAVGRLDEKTDVNLRIQLPQCDKRIEIVARVVWLSESNRQAGVRFLSMSAEARTEINKWIESQNALGSSEAKAPVVAGKDTTGTAPKQPSILDSQREKWLSLMKEFEAQAPQQQASSVRAPQATVENQEPPAPPAPPIAVVRPRPEIVSRRFGERIKQDSAATPQKEPPAKWGPYSPKSSAAAKSKAAAAADQPAPPAIAPRAPVAPTTISESAILRPKPIVPAKGGVDADATRNILRRAAETASRTRALSQIAVVAVFALFSLLCFGIGTWVGRVANRHSQLQTKANPLAAATVAQTNPPPIAVDKHTDSPAPAGIEEKRKRPERAPAHLVTENRVHKAAATAKPAGSTQFEPSAPSLAPPLQANSAPPTANHAPDLSANIETAPVNYITEAPNPRVVDGHILRPSDRFNPCHLTYQVEPTYPPEAQQQGIQGTVKIHLVIGPDGSVSSEQLISGPPQLASAALEATKYWRYLPALLNGSPVQTQKDVEVAFRLAR